MQTDRYNSTKHLFPRFLAKYSLCPHLAHQAKRWLRANPDRFAMTGEPTWGAVLTSSSVKAHNEASPRARTTAGIDNDLEPSIIAEIGRSSDDWLPTVWIADYIVMCACRVVDLQLGNYVTSARCSMTCTTLRKRNADISGCQDVYDSRVCLGHDAWVQLFPLWPSPKDRYARRNPLA